MNWQYAYDCWVLKNRQFSTHNCPQHSWPKDKINQLFLWLPKATGPNSFRWVSNISGQMQTYTCACTHTHTHTHTHTFQMVHYREKTKTLKVPKIIIIVLIYNYLVNVSACMPNKHFNFRRKNNSHSVFITCISYMAILVSSTFKNVSLFLALLSISLMKTLVEVIITSHLDYCKIFLNFLFLLHNAFDCLSRSQRDSHSISQMYSSFVYNPRVASRYK